MKWSCTHLGDFNFLSSGCQLGDHQLFPPSNNGAVMLQNTTVAMGNNRLLFYIMIFPVAMATERYMLHSDKNGLRHVGLCGYKKYKSEFRPTFYYGLVLQWHVKNYYVKANAMIKMSMVFTLQQTQESNIKEFPYIAYKS